MKAAHEFKTITEYNEYLRWYFAGMAMQGIVSTIPTPKGTALDGIKICNAAVEIADELLKQLAHSK